MMRVVIVHNHYRSDRPSGENLAVRNAGVDLEAAGAEVVYFERFSDDIGRLSWTGKAALPFAPIWSLSAQRDFAELLRRVRPDAVQLHNPYPLISPAVVRVAKRAGVAVLNVIHNYRHICLAATLRRDGADCTLCPDSRSHLPAVAKGCYRGSVAQTAVMAASGRVHAQTWAMVDRFVAVSSFVRDRLVDGGIDGDRIVVNRNVVPDPGPASAPDRPAFLFVGRLDDDKGVPLLLDAWRRSGLGGRTTLEIAGSGPLEGLVAEAAAAGGGVVRLGQLGRDDLAAAYRRASTVVMPSVWHDPCPLTPIEALSHGRPVIATTMGGLPELVDGTVGWLTAPEPGALAARLVEAAGGWDLTLAKARAARARYETEFTPEAARQRLLDIHLDVVGTTPRPVPAERRAA